MKTKLSIQAVIIISLVGFGLLACNSGSSAVAINDLPAYPNATELKAGESNIGDTLAQNAQQDAALRQALGGLKGKVEQKGFQLPADTTWEQVKSFYEKELKGSGWSSGLGGVANSLVDVNAVMESANQGNDLFQTALWSKNKQNLTIVMMTDPTDQTKKHLILSLSTQ